MPRIMLANEMLLTQSKPHSYSKADSAIIFGSSQTMRRSIFGSAQTLRWSSGVSSSLSSSSGAQHHPNLQSSSTLQTSHSTSNAATSNTSSSRNNFDDDDNAADDWGFFVDLALLEERQPTERRFLNGYDSDAAAPLGRTRKTTLTTIADAGC